MTLTVLEFPEKLDDVARLYGAVRDICSGSGASTAERIAVLELVKAEIVRDLQAVIDTA